jgi:NTP pyrophosphatase (non-canonical NTP hydrolase)
VKPLDLEGIHRELEHFVQERDWDQFHSLKNLSMALSVEASELVEIFQWVSEKDSNAVKNDPLMKARLEEELADIMTYLLRISSKAEINLEEAILKKIKKNALKYPVDLARGSSKKYNEL